MKINVQDPSTRFRPVKDLEVAQGALQQVQKKGPDALFRPQKLDVFRGNSLLTSLQQVATRLTSESAVQRNVVTEGNLTQSQEGNTLRRWTVQNTASATQTQSRSQLSQTSEQLVHGKVNGNNAFSHTSRDLQQSSVAAAATRAQDNRRQFEEITRQIEKKGATTRTQTHIDSAQERALAQQTEATRRTDTDLVVKTYDKAGKVVSDKTTRQAVTTTQATDVDQSVSATASRDIVQTTAVSAGKDGKADVRQTRTATDEAAAGHQDIDTSTTSRTTTLVEVLDQNGALLSTRRSAQDVQTDTSRSIDTARTQSSEQVSHTRTTANETDTRSKSNLTVHAQTVDHTDVTSTTKAFNGDGALVRESTVHRDVTVTTTEDRSVTSQAHSSTIKEKAATIASQETASRDQSTVVSHTVANQNGVRTERLVTTENDVRAEGELDSRVDANGNRTIEVAAELERRRDVHELSIDARGQGRLVATQTVSRQKVEGELDYERLSSVTASAAAGLVGISFGAMTGLRSSFKMDDGALEFDFEATVMSGTTQAASTGAVVTTRGDADSAARPSTSAQASAETLRFKGQIVASRDASGNRVLDVDATVLRDTAAVAASGGAVTQAERRHTELQLDARLVGDRQTAGDGTVRTQTSGELDVQRVDRTEAAGTTPSLQRLTSDDSLRAGFSLHQGALQFNFGVFNFGISLFA